MMKALGQHSVALSLYWTVAACLVPFCIGPWQLALSRAYPRAYSCLHADADVRGLVTWIIDPANTANTWIISVNRIGNLLQRAGPRASDPNDADPDDVVTVHTCRASA